MYILGDIYVVELEIFLSRAFTCSQASLFTLFRALYSELLNEFEQVEWLHWWKRSVVMVSFMNLLSSRLYPYSLARQDASYIIYIYTLLLATTSEQIKPWR